MKLSFDYKITIASISVNRFAICNISIYLTQWISLSLFHHSPERPFDPTTMDYPPPQIADITG